jgi:hypothetical protein
MSATSCPIESVKNPLPEDVALFGAPSKGAWSNGVVEYWSEIEERVLKARKLVPICFSHGPCRDR